MNSISGKERRESILNAAERLFFSKGFIQTSTSEIAKEVGIARGTLYHHFKSKEEILTALIDSISETIISRAKIAAENSSLSIKERIQNIIFSMKVESPNKKEIMEHIHKPENSQLHNKIKKSLYSGIIPLLAKVVEEGVAQGLFNTPYPYEAMEMTMVYLTTILDDDLIELSEEDKNRRVFVFLYNLERILGTESGDLRGLCI